MIIRLTFIPAILLILGVFVNCSEDGGDDYFDTDRLSLNSSSYRYIPEPLPDVIDNGRKYVEVHCSFKNAETLVRHPSNCSRSFVCSHGMVAELPPCQKGTVFSEKSDICVKIGSKLDDCNELPFDVPPKMVKGNKPSLVWHPKHRHHSINNLKNPTTIKAEGLEVDPMICKSGKVLLDPHPENCAWYYNCSAQPDAVMETFYNGFIMECPYPQLFSSVTLQCEDFEDVACRGRYEPKSPCDYRANHCHETSHCIPCWVRYASCLQLPDGLNPWPELEWKPFFVECYKERTVFQGACDKSAVFSPLTRACETPYSIPRQHGGWRPVCDSRRDGIYADEYGRCDIFYVCKNFDFAGFFRCDDEQMFDPLTSTCQGPSTVPYPCGDLEMPNLCELLPDGKYMDMFGRCTHYFECKNRKLKEIAMCPTGVFNPETRNCDTSKDMPKPCGLFDNPCIHEDDGFVTDPSVCTKVYLCERGLTMASFDCDKNITLTDTKECVGGRDVSNMCMIQPDCTNKLDGFYPDIQNGVDVYYKCESNAIQRHYTCDREKGGTVFIPSKQRCDFPEDLCYDVYRFPNKC